MNTQSALIIAKKFVEETKSMFPVDRAYLFGSYAKRNNIQESDIDVCIVSPVFGKDYFAEESQLRRLSLRVDPRISPVAFNPSDFKDRYSQLAYEINKYGVKLL